MTSASGLYTLTRRIGGNVGYAFLATVVASRQQFHHARLAASLTQYGGAYMAYQSATVVGRLVNQQSTMLAYNDASWLLGLLFLLGLPLILLLPGPHRIRADAQAAAQATPSQPESGV